MTLFLFLGSDEDFEQKLEKCYELEEEGDELYDIVGGKVAALFSFWYYSSGAVSTADFAKLDEDIERSESLICVETVARRKIFRGYSSWILYGYNRRRICIH